MKKAKSGQESALPHSRIKWQQNVGFLFILPWLFGFLAFKTFPLLMSFYISFTEYRIITPPFFIGFENFIQVFTDPTFFQSVKVSLLYVLMTVPTRMLFALFIAYVLSSKVKGIGIFRSLYYIPSLMGGSVAVAVLWAYMFRSGGLVNLVLGFLHIPPLPWMSHPVLALFVISVLHVWQFGATMVIFLAALKGVPGTLIEAAVVDGATRTRTFWSVIIPYITPVIFFNLLNNLVAAFQEFNSAYVITAGGPSHGTYLMSLMIYQNAFRYLKMGYSSALSWIWFTTITLVTICLFISSKKWVNYQD
jgi:oligogalacturonide transport system permease protein